MRKRKNYEEGREASEGRWALLWHKTRGVGGHKSCSVCPRRSSRRGARRKGCLQQPGRTWGPWEAEVCGDWTDWQRHILVATEKAGSHSQLCRNRRMHTPTPDKHLHVRTTEARAVGGKPEDDLRHITREEADRPATCHVGCRKEEEGL